MMKINLPGFFFFHFKIFSCTQDSLLTLSYQASSGSSGITATSLTAVTSPASP